jgi:aminopeptidase
MPFDLRTRKLAQLAVRECIKVKPNQKIIISGGDEAIPFLVELYKEIILQKAIPIIKVGLPNISDFFFKYATKQQLEHFPDYWFDTIKQCQGYIGINTTPNTKELSNSDSKKISLKNKKMHKISDYVCNERKKIKRTTIAFPCPALAQEAEMSLTEYENFVYGACLQDWAKIKKLMKKILLKFKENSSVHLIGENINLKFKVHGHLAKDDSDFDNMPAGEVFMAPIKTSVNGWVKFEYNSIKYGKEISNICLEFKDGEVIAASADKNQDLLQELIKTDENSKYLGEFGIGCNPKITKYTNNLLFDEKINATIHLALGMAYKENGGGNDSAIHWDIVKDMRKAKIVVDGKIIQDKGKWKL